MRKELKFKKGEQVWFYPNPTLFPKRKEKIKILEVHRTPYGKVYRVKNSFLPSFHHASQFSKIDSLHSKERKQHG